MEGEYMGQGVREQMYVAQVLEQLRRAGEDQVNNHPMRNPWTCAACSDDYTFAEHRPLYLGGERLHRYCVGCVERNFDAIANGIEDNGVPKLDEDVLHEMPEVMARIDPELRARFEANLVCFRPAPD